MGVYRVKQGETLDMICHRTYGRAAGYVELVLEANYRLADHMQVLPMGREIILPEVRTAPAKKLVNLWD